MVPLQGLLAGKSDCLGLFDHFTGDRLCGSKGEDHLVAGDGTYGEVVGGHGSRYAAQ